MATNDKIVIIKGSSVLQVTNPTGATFLGYKTVNGEKQTIQVDFSNMTPLFGVSQSVGSSTTLAPSENAVKNAIKEILTDNTMLASNTQNGLITIDQYKSIEDMITNFQELINSQTAIKDEIKRIADVTDNPFYSIEQKYTHTATMICNNEAPTFVSKFLAIKGSGSPIIATSRYSINKAINTASDTSFDMFIEENGVVKLGTNSSLSAFSLLAASVPIVAYLILRSSATNSLGLDNQAVLGLDITECPSLSALYARNTRFANIDLSKNANIKTINLSGNVEMATVNFSSNLLLDNATLNGMAKLGSITLPTSTSNLKTLGISGTTLTKDKIMAIGNLWESRVDKTAGTITISPAIFNSMTDEEKNVFTSKNINIATL